MTRLPDTRHAWARVRWRAAWRLLRASTRNAIQRRPRGVSSDLLDAAQEALYQRTVHEALTSMRAVIAHRHSGACPKCYGARSRMRYPGGNPEDGPARLECRKCGHAPSEALPPYHCAVWGPDYEEALYAEDT